MLSYRKDLLGKSGIYAFICLTNGKRYIGSSQNIYKRFLDHLAGRSSNLLLQRAFTKQGKQNFQFVVYAYAPYNLPAITDLETLFMSYFPFNSLYNFTKTATSMYGYKHTIAAINKMKDRLIDPNNHPMFGKTHSAEAHTLISKQGTLNPMYGKEHSPKTRLLISDKRSKAVTLYNKDMTYILTFKNNTQLAAFIGCYKGTVARYLNSGKLYQNKYFFRS